MTTPVTDEKHEDAFENDIDTRTNVLDLASHYPYSPERWRIFVDGSRVFPEYGSVSQYTHDTDRHKLQPAGGETVAFESAERPRYVVQYELASTFALKVNQSLTGADRIRIGLYDGSDGWYIEHNGGHPDLETGDAVMERNGSEVYREEDVPLRHPLDKFARLRLQTGWYDVTRQSWERSYPENNGDQQNPEIVRKGAPESRGPQTGNLPLRYEVTADANTSGLVLQAGSAAQVNLGKTTQFSRSKSAQTTATVDATGVYVPLFAARVRPDLDVVSVQLQEIAINEFGGNADIQVVVQSFAPEKVADTNGNQLGDADFSTPPEFNRTNNAIETSTAVEQVANDSGTVTTDPSDLGGFQLGHDTVQSGGGNTVTNNTRGRLLSKRPLYSQDIAVVLGNAGGTGDATITMRTEQDW